MKGTDRLTRLGKLSVVFGVPVEIDDLRDREIADGAREATVRLMERIAELEASL